MRLLAGFLAILSILLNSKSGYCEATEQYVTEKKVRVNSKLPELTVRIIWKKDMEFNPTTLEIIEPGKETSTQTVPVESDLYFEESTDELPEDFLQAIDYNFDGYKDLQLIAATGTGQTTYQVWMYLPEEARFLERPDLSIIIVDSEHKLTYELVEDMGSKKQIFFSIDTKNRSRTR